MMRLCLLFFFVICSSPVFCQNQSSCVFRFNEVFQIARSNYYRLGVIDMRVDKSNIGHIKSRTNIAQEIPITTEQPFDEFLSAYFTSILPEGVQSNKELILVLYDFRMHTTALGAGFGSVYFYGDFYNSKDGKFAFLGTTNSIMELASGTNINKAIQDVTRKYIDDELSDYAVAVPAQQNAGSFSINEITQRRIKEKLKYPIYRQGNFKKGIYRNVDQFLNGEPTDTSFIEKKHFAYGHKCYQFYYPDSNGNKGERIEESAYFAIYDGEKWLLSEFAGGELMNYNNGDFYVIIFSKDIKKKETTDFMTSLASGIIDVKDYGIGDHLAVFDPESKRFNLIARLN